MTRKLAGPTRREFVACVAAWSFASRSAIAQITKQRRTDLEHSLRQLRSIDRADLSVDQQIRTMFSGGSSSFP